MTENKIEYIRPIFIIVIITILAMFKIYLANETYYTSRDIQKLSSKISALKEEKNLIELKIEKLKYKNTIIDPLFTYKHEETIEATPNIKKRPIIKQPRENKIPDESKKKSTQELFNTINTEDIF